MSRRLRAAGICCTDRVLGLGDSGRMGAARLHGYLRSLPDGVSELYVHAAVQRWDGEGAWPADYDGRAEFEALVDPAMRRLIDAGGIEAMSFAELAEAAA
jgi:chitin disaccharide deacetylase